MKAWGENMTRAGGCLYGVRANSSTRAGCAKSSTDSSAAASLSSSELDQLCRWLRALIVVHQPRRIVQVVEEETSPASLVDSCEDLHEAIIHPLLRVHIHVIPDNGDVDRQRAHDPIQLIFVFCADLHLEGGEVVFSLPFIAEPPQAIGGIMHPVFIRDIHARIGLPQRQPLFLAPLV